MSKYKRLTKQKWSNEIDLTQELGYSYIYKGLYELENLFDNGQLVELPCKVGDKVYRKDGVWTVVGFECNRANGWKVKLERWKNKYLDEHKTIKIVFSSFGKTVFLTEEEATEAHLKELQEGKR